MSHIHTYPVDPSLTSDQAWEELCFWGFRMTYTGPEKWSNIECDGEKCYTMFYDI